MIIFVAAILCFSVFYFGAVHYWAIACCHLCALGGILFFLIAAIRKERLVLAPSMLYLSAIAGILAVTVHLSLSPAYFFARKELLILSCVCMVFFLTLQWADSLRRVSFITAGICFLAFLAASLGVYFFYAAPDRTYEILKPSEYWRRATGPFISPNHFGDILAVTLPLAVVMLAGAFGAPGRLSGWKRYVPVTAAVLMCAVILYALAFTFSRGSMAAAVAGLLLMCLLLLRHADLRRGVWISVAVIAVLFAALALQPRQHGRAAEKISAGDSARIAVARDSLRMIADAPLLGHGAGMYRWVFPKYKSDGIRRVVDYAHNDYLHIAAETGFLGLGLFCLALFILYRQGVRAARVRGAAGLLSAGLLGSLTVGLLHAFVDFNLHITATAVFLAVVAGCIAALHRLAAGGPARREIPLNRDAVKVVSWIIAFAVFLWMAADARIIAAAFLYDRGEQQTSRLDWDAALTSYRRAFQLDPKNPVIAGKIAELNYKKYIFARTERDLLRDEALAWYTMAVSLNPYDGGIRVRQADFYQNIGEREKAEKQLRAAFGLDPHNGFYYLALGNYFMKSGDPSRAIPAFREALRIDPRDEIARALLKRASKQPAEENKR